MTISRRDAKLLLMLLGIIIFLLAYFLIYNTYNTRTEELNAQITQLSSQAQELRDHYQLLDTYYAGIDQAEEVIEEELEHYPSVLRTEDLVVYAIAIEDTVGVDATSLAFTGDTLMSTFDTPEETEGTVSARSLSAYQTGMTMTLDFTYAQLKSLLNYVSRDDERTALDSINISFDSETGALTGSATISKYFINSADEELAPSRVPAVPLGTDDLFRTYEVAQAAEETTEAE